MPALSVSLDMIGVLREAGSQKEPDPAQAAVLVELAGADGLSVQLRRDRKYIRDRDLFILKNITKTKLGVEIPAIEEILDRTLEIKPHSATIVAETTDSDSPVTTVDLHSGEFDYNELVSRFNGSGIKTNFLIEPEIEAVKSVAKTGAAGVLLNCLGYADAADNNEAREELDRIDRAAQAASRQGLIVYAGRGLDYKNISPLVELGYIAELVIGRAICVRALFTGLEKAVSEMIRAINYGQPSNTG